MGNVRLPVIGEMFSGNDIKTITINDRFWTMNLCDSTSCVRVISSEGDLVGRASDESWNPDGVRPVIFLKKGKISDLTFTKGDGTLQNPYWLGN